MDEHCDSVLLQFDSLRIIQPADEPPAAKIIREAKHDIVAALLQVEVNNVVFNIHDPEKARVAITKRTAPGKDRLTI